MVQHEVSRHRPSNHVTHRDGSLSFPAAKTHDNLYEEIS